MPSSAIAAAAAEPAKGQEVCKLSDDVLAELSGIAAYEDGYFVINDSSDNPEASKVFYLDGKCKLQGGRAIEYPGAPSDTEDMALSPDGKTLWVGDIGDNEGKRATIGLFKIDLAAEDPKAVYYPLRYPGDNAPNAEALLVNGDGTPIVVTKEAAIAHLWVPSAPLEKTENGIELKEAGEWKIPLTETSTWLGVPGRLAVTGGAVAPGGAKVTLRTYADAFEWEVQNGDVIAAVTSGEPRITGLPDESFGEAITYNGDGSSYVTVSEVSPGQQFAKDTPKLLKYAPADNAVQADAAGGDGQGDDRAFWEKLSLGQITAAVASVGIVGLLMLGGGIAGIVMFRRRNPEPIEDESPLKSKAAEGSGDGDPERSGGIGPESSGANRREPAAAGAGYGGAARSGGVYGGGPAGMSGGGSGAVYGGNGSGSGAARSGGVYGGGPAGMNGGGSGAVSGAVYGAGGKAEGPGGGKAGGGKAGGVYGGGPAGMNGGGSGAVYGAGGRGAAPGGPGGGQGRGGQGGPRGGRGPQDPQQSGGVYGGGPAGMNGGGSGAVYGAGGQSGGGQGRGGQGGPRGGGPGGGGPRGGGSGAQGGGPRGGGQGGPGAQGGPGGPRGGQGGAPGGGPRAGGPGGPRAGSSGGPRGGAPRGPQQSGGNPVQSGGNPMQSGGHPQGGGRGRPPRQGGGGGVYGGGPAGMNGGGSGAVYGGAEDSGGHDRRDGRRGDYPQNPPYDDRRR
ncbi:hypothetical protein [Catenuloplanes atrovinosus]|nr:hypothetical protein [Catenuloplanes atrovinosus]